MVKLLMNKLISIVTVLISFVFLSSCYDEKLLSLNEHSIVYCSESSPATFNPQLTLSNTAIDATSNQLYDKLIAYQGDGSTLGPALAKSWHVSNDGKKITFYLRKHVTFHQTAYFTPSRLLTADDVIFSFNRILDVNHPFHHVSGGTYPFFKNIDFSNLVQKIEKINDHTVRFHLAYTDNSFLANLATDFAVILSAEYGKQLTKYKTKHDIDIYPVGTGPFKLKEYRVGSFIRYYRHEQYWQKPTQIEQLVFDITSSNTGRLTKLLAKECDISSNPIAHEIIHQRDDLTIDSVTALDVSYFGFNMTRAPFDNKLVRQAISHAINKKALLDTIYQNKAELANSILPSTSWAYDETVKEPVFNIALAKELLSKAGYGDGFTMDLWVMPEQKTYNPDPLTMAKLIQADLKKINIKVIIVSDKSDTFLHRLSAGEQQTFILGWSAEHSDPDAFFTPKLSCTSTNNHSRTFWCNEKYDNIIEKALQTTNINQRKKYYAQAMAIVEQEIPLIPIAHSKRYQARGENVQGKVLSSFRGVSFYHVVKNNDNVNVLHENKSQDTVNKAGNR